MSSTLPAFDLVVLLHGVGASGADLAPLGEVWARRLPGVAFAAPDAPQPFDGAAMGRQWFSILGVTPANRGARIAVAASAFDAVVDAAMAKAGTTVGRTVLCGFSQGTIMALDAIARGRRFAGVLGFSGRMATEPTVPLAGLPVHLVHGEADGVIPIAESVSARDRLAAAGARVDFVAIPGDGHGIGPAAAASGLAFLRKLAGLEG